MHSIGNGWLWTGFFFFVLMVLSIDIFFLGRGKSHRVSTRESLSWTVIWVLCALAFNYLLWWYLHQSHGIHFANQKAEEFFTGYLIEEALSVDNMFAFLLVFNYFLVPEEYQRRVLLYGVLGAIVMRFLMIFAGIWLVLKIHWILYLFGLFLVITGIKMFFMKEKEGLSDNSLLSWLRRRFRVTEKFHGERFFVRQNAMWYVTPLFLALILIEVSDLVFALDSIPAVFAITQDPFIVFTSNIFAILGLRTLYFLLARMAARFHLLKWGIAIMLMFIGTKMLIAPWIEIPVEISLGVVAATLVTSALLSLVIPKHKIR